MPCVLPYGLQSQLGLDLPDETLLAVFDEPHGRPLTDPAAGVARALDDPLNFPALSLATVPGDRIALALEPSVPQAATLVAATGNYLVEHGASPDHLAVLVTPAGGANEGDPRALLPDAWREEVTLETHAPETTGTLSLLGSNHEGKPVYMNRTLLDADLVVPIGCIRHQPTIGYYGRYGGLFPAFADVQTQSRFHKPPPASARRQHRAKQREEIDEIGWMLGTQFTVQALPGGGEQLLDVLAGDIREVFRAGSSDYAQAWTFQAPRRANLVIASISGGRDQQTWQNVARALAAASCVAADGGAIALCTELAADPGPAISGLSRLEDREQALKNIRREHAADAAEAIELVRATEQAKVYLLSRLDETLVEDLGIAHIDDPGDVARLARRHDSCIVLSNAQYVIPVMDEG